MIIKKSPLVVKWQTAKADITTVTDTIKNENENDQYDQTDLEQSVGDEKSTANNGDMEKESPKQDSVLSATRNESRSFRSFRSFSQNPIKDNPEYEYLEPVKAYRCLECRGIFSINTKDSMDGHPCNSRLKGSVGF